MVFSKLLDHAIDAIAPNPIASRDVRIRGAATFHSLRHAAAVSVVQGLLDQSVHLTGNFSPSLCVLANALGHNVATLLGSYVGTAAVMLKWEYTKDTVDATRASRKMHRRVRAARQTSDGDGGI